MSEAPKSQPAFSFGIPATSAPASSSLFGQTTLGNQNAPSNLFGQNNNTPASSAPSLFGNQTAPTGAVQTPLLFGGNQGASGGTQTPSLFGGSQASGGFTFGNTGSGFGNNTASSAPSTGFSFGQKPAESQQNSSNASIIGGSSSTSNQNAAPPSAGQTQTSNLFGTNNTGEVAPSPFSNLGSAPASMAPIASPGSSTPAANKTNFSISTTPAGPPPSQSGGLFNFPKPQQTNSNLFGGSTGNQATQQTAQNPSSNLFGGGNTQNTSSNLFGGAKPADTTKSGSNLFGGQQGSTLFQNLGKPQNNSAATSGTSTPASAPPVLTQATSQQNQQNKPSPFLPPATVQQAQQDNAAKPSPFLFPTAPSRLAQEDNASKLSPFSFAQAGGQPGQQDNAAKPNPFSFPSAPSQDSNASKPAFSLSGADSSKPSEKPAFGFPPQAKSDDTTSKPASNTPFSVPTTSTTDTQASATPSTAATSSTFGAPAATSSGTSAPTVTTSLPAFNLPSQTSTSTSTTTPSAPAAPSLFPKLGDMPALGTSTTVSQPSTSTAVPATTTSTTQQQQHQQPSTSAPTTTLGASTAGPAPPASSRLKGKSMDEIITRWASDLSKHQKDFQDAADKVASWDRLLVENSDKISKLYSRCFQAERDTAEVERQLSSVEGQQEELSAWLDRYEMEVERLMGDNVGRGGDGLALQGPDQERERTYKLAEKLSDRLNDMGKDLGSMIEEINNASATLSKTSRPDDPLSQIVRVLNNHLSQLQIIDTGAAALQAQVATAQKEAQRMGGGANGYGPLGSDAVDDFYKSYMRRG